MRNLNSSFLTITAIALVFSGCATPEVSSVDMDGVTVTVDISSVSRYDVIRTVDIGIIALDTSSVLLGETVANELSSRGLTVIKASETGRIFARSGATEIEITQPKNMMILKAEGIDAYLILESSGVDNEVPQSVTAWLIDTATGKMAAEATWQGRNLESEVNRMMKQDLGDVAKQLVDELGKVFGFSG